jgi:hypothetical protein
MRRPPEHPRFALVVWPNNTIGCLFLAAVPDAVARGALVFAREDAELMTRVPFNPPRVNNDLEQDGA